jgi:hypothetical protein
MIGMIFVDFDVEVLAVRRREGVKDARDSRPRIACPYKWHSAYEDDYGDNVDVDVAQNQKSISESGQR